MKIGLVRFALLGLSALRLLLLFRRNKCPVAKLGLLRLAFLRLGAFRQCAVVKSGLLRLYFPSGIERLSFFVHSNECPIAEFEFLLPVFFFLDLDRKSVV